MAADDKVENPGERQPINPAVRRRLQQQFEAGNKIAVTGNFEYATTMYEQSVKGDPGNQVYVQTFLGNLQKQYGNNKKGANFAGLRGSSARNAVKAAQKKQDWPEVLKSGVEMLKINPWDATTLFAMSEASEELGFDDCQLVYLRFALDADIKDVEANRRAGLALGRQGLFDQATACWVRVQQAKPGDEEAQREIGKLTVEKTIAKGGYGNEKEAQARMEKSGEQHYEGETKLTRVQELEKQISRKPTELAAYIELAEIHNRADKFAEAAEVLSKAIEVSPGEIRVRDMLDDVRLKIARNGLAIAEQQAAKLGTDQAKKVLQNKRAEVNKLELDVFRTRSDRDPANMHYRYELGMRLKRAGNFPEAIKCFQDARNDPKRRGTVLLELGECFQHIKQYKLAMSNYVAAIESMPEREEENRKLALYRAGKLGFFLKEYDVADKHLTVLAGLDFSYKDVGELLQRLSTRDAG